MPIELLPIVSWITQDSGAPYEDSLQQIVSSFHGLAHKLLVRHAPPEKSGCEPRDLVFKALFALQREIFDQYLPPVEARRERSVGGIWPDWALPSMKVALDTGQIYSLSPLPEGNGSKHEREVDGVTYKFTFYRNDSEQQRRKWLYKMLEEEARSEGRSSHRKQDVQLDESLPLQDESAASMEAGLRLREWRSVTDRDDWRTAFRASKGDAPVERQARSRAKARLRAAYIILYRSLPSGASRPYLERLRRAGDGERRAVLDEYLRRYST
jgi:hypothetical protein